MIGKIAGRLEHRGPDHVLIDNGGVGYVVFCSERTLGAMPPPGAAVALYTDLLVREDLLQLFGFLTPAEREWHRLLTSVQGVGAKGALAILGTLGPDGVARALSLGDTSAIRSAPGIGPKIAQRLILELRAKAPAVMALGAEGARQAMVPGTPGTRPEPAPAAAAPPPMAAPAETDGTVAAAVRADALSALFHLGYGQGEAATAIAEAGDAAGADAAGLIRAALRRLAPQG